VPQFLRILGQENVYGHRLRYTKAADQAESENEQRPPHSFHGMHVCTAPPPSYHHRGSSSKCTRRSEARQPAARQSALVSSVEVTDEVERSFHVDRFHTFAFNLTARQQEKPTPSQVPLKAKTQAKQPARISQTQAGTFLAREREPLIPAKRRQQPKRKVQNVASWQST
jgi:hypothetical protein